MAKGNGNTRASASNNPRGLNEKSAPVNRISDISANQLGYGDLTRENSTYSKKDRDAYISKNLNVNALNDAAEGGNTPYWRMQVGDVTVTAQQRGENEFGIARFNYTISDNYGHAETATGFSTNIEDSVRKGVDKFLKAWPQRK